MSVEFRQDCRFGVRSYCVREERQGALRLRPAVGGREPPQIFSYLQNLGIPVLPLASPLPYPPFRPQLRIARKTASPAGKAQKSFTKGKKLTNQTFQDHASKKNDNRRREAGRYKPLSEFPQDREYRGHEEAVLRTALSFGALWRLYL